MSVRLAVIGVMALLLTSCGGHTQSREPVGSSSQPVKSSLRPSVPAPTGPAVFPDLARYTPVRVEDYGVDMVSPGITNTFTRFLAPGGVSCSFDTTGEYSALCIGPSFPGVSIPAPQFDYGDGSGIKISPGEFGIATNVWLRYFNQLPPRYLPQLKPLPPMHSITKYGVTCGVDDAGATACIDPKGRGFLLSSAWSGWLSHVTPGQVLTSAPIHCTEDAGTTSCKDGEHGFVYSRDPHRYDEF